MTIEKKLAEIIIKNKNKYFCWVSRPATMQRISFLVKAFHRWIGTKTIGVRGEGNNFSYYFEKDKYALAGSRLVKQLNSRSAIKKHFSNYKNYSSRLLAVGREAKLAKADKNELLKIFQKYNEVLSEFAYYLVSPFWIDEYVFPDLANKLKKIIVPEKYASALETISSPTILFGYQRYHIDLAKAKTKKEHEMIAKRYRWVKEYSFQERLLDTELALIDHRELKREGLLAAALKAPALVAKNKKRLKKLLLSFKNKKIREQAELVNAYINLKTERIEIYKIFQTDFRNFFYRLLELMRESQPEIKYEDIISLVDEEFSAYLKFGKKVNLAITRKRLALDFVSLSIKGDMNFIYNRALIKKIRKTYLSVSAINEIKGVVVSKGKTRGHVRLIISHSDLNKLKSGEILVANFTSPEYVPAMKKAAAIVTDDGGITSHAAIISRELGKPCVTGTKLATRVLKNGDLVEVDADKGIVKIIKRK